MNRFLVGKSIGEGQFGSIRAATVKGTGEEVVLKIIPVSRLSEGIPHPVARECIIAPMMDHIHVVRTLEAFPDGAKMVLVMEYCHSNLRAFISEHSVRQPVPKQMVKRLAFMLLSGVEYVHSRGVLHRDIKPANCLLTEDYTLKLGDFGLSRVFDRRKERGMSHEVQTRWYRAPELLLGKRCYGEEVDIWSVGCVVAELLRGYGDAIFCGDGDISQLSQIFDVLGTPDEETASQMPDWEKIHFDAKKGSGLQSVFPIATAVELDFMSGMLSLNPKKRWSISALMHHSFFSAP